MKKAKKMTTQKRMKKEVSYKSLKHICYTKYMFS